MLKAAKEDIAVIIVPIAFVSDHSETLVELDIEYKELFAQKCDKAYVRVDALNEDKDFILSLAEQVNLTKNDIRQCPKEFCKCFKEL